MDQTPRISDPEYTEWDEYQSTKDLIQELVWALRGMVDHELPGWYRPELQRARNVLAVAEQRGY